MTDEQLKIYKEVLPGATDEQLEAVGRFVESVVGLWQEVSEAFISFVRAIAPTLNTLVRHLDERAELEKCPNRKVRHLALHARKARTRKKNLHRALRITEKEAKG